MEFGIAVELVFRGADKQADCGDRETEQTDDDNDSGRDQSETEHESVQGVNGQDDKWNRPKVQHNLSCNCVRGRPQYP